MAPDVGMFLLMVVSLGELVSAVNILPTVVWDPRRPIFACDHPIIHVQLTDQLNFMCPPYELHSYMSNQKDARKRLYENLYFLDTNEEAYSSCNATAAKRLLYCEHGSSMNVYNTMFRSSRTSQDGIVFNEGKTYYFIGTGYRTKENIDNVIGGSCNTTNDVGYYKLRLKIYVCTKEDVQNGRCHVCKSEGCYYKDCEISCSPWEDEVLKKSNSNCFMIQKRTCTNRLLVESKDSLRDVPSRCGSQPVKGASVVYNNVVKDSDKNKYIAIGAAVLAFILGVLAGVFFHRYYSNKTQVQENSSNEVKNGEPKQGQENPGFRQNVYEGYDHNVNSKSVGHSISY